jgi:hypothetical protein
MKTFKLINNESGIALIIALTILLALTVLGIAALTTTNLDIIISSNERMSYEALQLADAGIDRVLADLLKDFADTSDDNADKWANDNFYTLAYGKITLPSIYHPSFANLASCGSSFNCPSDSEWATYGVDPYGGIQPLGEKGGYKVLIMRDANNDKEVYALSRAWLDRTTAGTDSGGTLASADKRVLLYLKAVRTSPWDSAIFAGSGYLGTVINGNINIAGTIHILGTGQTGDVLALSGTALVSNTYEGVPEFSDTVYVQYRIPPEPVINGKKDLQAYVRIKNGTAYIAGNAHLGQADTVADEKRTLAGIYITDGFSDDTKDSVLKTNIYADNYDYNIHGRQPEDYDLGDKIQMPSMSDEYKDPTTGIVYSSYSAFVNATALRVIPSNCKINTASFTCKDPDGNVVDCSTGVNGNSFQMTGDSLTISGLVAFRSEDLPGCADIEFDGKDYSTMTYTGRGTIYTDLNVEMEQSLVPAGQFATEDVVGIVTSANIHVNPKSKSEIMAALYAANTIAVSYQTVFAGTLVSNYFDLTQVPTILQVPELSDNLPPGMIASEPVYSLAKVIRKEQW